MNQEQTLELFRQGREAWNKWADQMRSQRQALADSGAWPLGGEIPQNDPSVGTWREKVAAVFEEYHFEHADFRDFIFPDSVDFSDAEFDGDTVFRGAVFKGPTVFMNAKFDGPTTFSDAEFKGPTVFMNAKFDGPTTFSDAEFKGPTVFMNAKFDGFTGFRGAKFDGRTFFRNAEFSGDTDFSDAKFKGPMTFNDAEFKGPTTFSDAEFKGPTTFSDAEFKGTTGFGRAEFDDDTDFSDAKFSGDTDFSDAKFKGLTSFIDAEFKGPMTFNDAEFKGTTDFSDAEFSGDTDFIRLLSGKGIAFQRTTFHRSVSFEAMIATGACDLAESTFHEVPNFNQASFSKAPRLNSLSVVAPETLKRQFKGDRELERRWQALRQIAIQAHDHAQEQEFFAEELKARRWVIDRPWSAAYWAGLLYQLVSNFGRSIFLPLFWLAVTVMTFAAGYRGIAATDSCVVGDGEPARAAVMLSLHNSVLFATGTFGSRIDEARACLYGIIEVGSRKVPEVADGAAALGALQVTISAALIFLVLLAVRNRFRIR